MAVTVNSKTVNSKTGKSKKRKSGRVQQALFLFKKHGGTRKGAGRKKGTAA